MLRLTDEQYDEAVRVGARALSFSDSKPGWALAQADTVLRAVAEDFDVSALDVGERNDVAEGNVWPDDDLESELDAADAVWNRAIDAALAVSPKPGKVTSWSKIL